jgi:hypothetical protein
LSLPEPGKEVYEWRIHARFAGRNATVTWMIAADSPSLLTASISYTIERLVAMANTIIPKRKRRIKCMILSPLR